MTHQPDSLHSLVEGAWRYTGMGAIRARADNIEPPKAAPCAIKACTFSPRGCMA